MKTMYKGDTRYEKVYEQMQLLGIQEVTTKQQSKNGTREFKLPIKDQHAKPIYVASFASGYVRRTKANGFSPSWQLNKTKKVSSGYKDFMCIEPVSYTHLTLPTIYSV